MSLHDTTNRLDFQTAGEAAADWWVSVLQDPTFDNGEPVPESMQNLVTGLRVAALTSDMDYSRFCELLATAINTALEDPENDSAIRFGSGFFVSTDYNPDKLLSQVADQADFRPPGSWPWKVRMWIKPEQIEVEYPDGAPVKVIWTKSE